MSMTWTLSGWPPMSLYERWRKRFPMPWLGMGRSWARTGRPTDAAARPSRPLPNSRRGRVAPYCEYLDVTASRYHNSDMRTTVGLPDVSCAGRGIGIWIRCRLAARNGGGIFASTSTSWIRLLPKRGSSTQPYFISSNRTSSDRSDRDTPGAEKRSRSRRTGSACTRSVRTATSFRGREEA